ncbi:hypothetical protein RO3G_02272 [Lichtheimia corymbifera JMRC:FSU:9682]|uniref:Uncharacterized protein n=1 Tax=Lichtheimia corymbifera JMRC:FSU:9682 TaxID=1263082 RepID=A0A068S9S9_9FUNG|nr:hypothetical protein RO3G_02272 [Lichtheimia corymbifera JMRC:FSU:9682]
MSIPGFEILTLAPEDDYNYNNNIDDPDESTVCNYIDDSFCQENLFQILPLMPEESSIDENNHIHSHVKLFFEELGVLTEEPEPIDPTRDYDAEARQLLEERDRTRQKHVQLSETPSLSSSQSGLSSTSSSCHHHDHHHNDYSNDNTRSPLYMGHAGGPNHHATSPMPYSSPYHPIKTVLAHEPSSTTTRHHPHASNIHH